MRILLALTETSIGNREDIVQEKQRLGKKLAKLTLKVADTDKVKKALESADAIKNNEELRVQKT